MLEDMSVLRLDGWLGGIRSFSFSYPKVSWQSTSSTCGVFKRKKNNGNAKQESGWIGKRTNRVKHTLQEVMVVKARTKVSKLYSRDFPVLLFALLR